MVKLGTFLKTFYTKMIQVTCVLRLYRITKEIREQFGTADELIYNMKTILCKVP